MPKCFLPVVPLLVATIACTRSEVGMQESAAPTADIAVDGDEQNEVEVLTGVPEVLLGKWAEGASRATPTIRHLAIHTNQLLSIVRDGGSLTPEVLTYHRVERSGQTVRIFSDEIGEQPLTLVFEGRDGFSVTQPEDWVSTYQRVKVLPPEFGGLSPPDPVATKESHHGLPHVLTGTWKPLGGEEGAMPQLAIRGAEMIRYSRKQESIVRQHCRIRQVEHAAGEVRCVAVDQSGTEESQKWVLLGRDLFSVTHPAERRATYVRSPLTEDQIVGRSWANDRVPDIPIRLEEFRTLIDDGIRRHISHLAVRSYSLLIREEGNLLCTRDENSLIRKDGEIAEEVSMLSLETSDEIKRLSPSERSAAYAQLLVQWESWVAAGKREVELRLEQELAVYQAASHAERQHLFESLLDEYIDAVSDYAAFRETRTGSTSDRKAALIKRYELATSPMRREVIFKSLIASPGKTFRMVEPDCLEVWEGLQVVRIGEIRSDELPKPHVFKERGK